MNLSPSPCLRRVRLLEERGVITGYAAKVDAAACGLEITAFIRISLQRHEGANVSDFEARVRRIPEILRAMENLKTALRIRLGDDIPEQALSRRISEIIDRAAVDIERIE